MESGDLRKIKANTNIARAHVKQCVKCRLMKLSVIGITRDMHKVENSSLETIAAFC